MRAYLENLKDRIYTVEDLVAFETVYSYLSSSINFSAASTGFLA
jgi:hypothetical protein